MHTPVPSGAPPREDALRAEHDALAARLAVRRSVDHLRRGAYAAFLVLVGGGLSATLAAHRWGAAAAAKPPPTGLPVFFLLAAAFTAVAAAVAVASFVRARQHMRQEDALFVRFRELRARLGLDA
jgi:hypothetical protein